MKITTITPEIFTKVESYLIENGLDSDKDKFSVIHDRLSNMPQLIPEEFAEELVYITLTSGFKQTTAKRFFYLIMDFLHKYPNYTLTEKDKLQAGLLDIFANKNKTNAIAKIWLNRKNYCDYFYSLKIDSERMKFLRSLPHVGDITQYHIARNLGINCVKYDIWIQRIGVALYDNSRQNLQNINNGKLHPDVRKVCDSMFDELSNVLHLPRGYIDLILWKSCQQGVFKINGYDIEFCV